MVVFRVANMRCGGCVRSVTSALRGVDPAVEVRVDLGRREVTVEGVADADVLAQALRGAGFEGERVFA
ncbi:heavy-metal-associated domain-containing protein [Belnapia rosea]|uniref:Copper chaperone n=1 Tax=Belnapia rosea TaxID=938405 RepID=A0A1G6V7H3_9PROT|nr:heavy metal-associated domain-containing protein [Belnapia rosea]SDD48957.1 copper chaperone [Belnapia rosea]